MHDTAHVLLFCSVPYEIAFVKAESLSQSDQANLAINAIFLVDIALSFITSADVEGKLLRDLPSIALHYVRTCSALLASGWCRQSVERERPLCRRRLTAHGSQSRRVGRNGTRQGAGSGKRRPTLLTRICNAVGRRRPPPRARAPAARSSRARGDSAEPSAHRPRHLLPAGRGAVCTPSRPSVAHDSLPTAKARAAGRPDSITIHTQRGTRGDDCRRTGSAALCQRRAGPPASPDGECAREKSGRPAAGRSDRPVDPSPCECARGTGRPASPCWLPAPGPGRAPVRTRKKSLGVRKGEALWCLPHVSGVHTGFPHAPGPPARRIRPAATPAGGDKPCAWDTVS